MISQFIKIYITDEKDINVVIDGIKLSEELKYYLQLDSVLSNLITKKVGRVMKRRVKQRIKECFRIYFRETIDDIVIFMGDKDKYKKKIGR